ncbi:DUF2167 domain-containing protein [Roseovarius sp. CAU 1744]|uniref:DUF2167 domain-containing protein n=1 Tax=Roseovarius sp. CAU 1744 TaxID=3140368 RepID=UPI00325B2C6F
MLRKSLAILILIALAGAAPAKPFKELFPQLAAELDAETLALLDGMDYRTGAVTVGDDLARFDLGERYYFLDADDARHVLVELWGNPPSQATLGMVFPIDKTPLHDTWGIEVSYEDIGYVSDEDAADYDYDALLKTMQKDTLAENTIRAEQGYAPIRLVGWADKPRYDADGRKLYWAKELSFGDMETNTLNYNIRALGRKGVLVVNFIAGMEQLEAVRAATPDVLEMVSFTPGNRYSDFDPSIDTVAAVGIGGLIAGKALAKTGFLAVALVFLKKFWFVALIPLFWLKNLIFRRRGGDS